MFARTLIDSDSFLDMPLTARLLYYDLCMRADDDGFVNAPKNIMRSVGASQDDLTLLLMKNFLIPFDSGVVAVRHWRVHNYIRQDRYKATTCAKEKNQLRLNDSGVYELAAEVQNPLVDQLPSSGQPRLGKDRLGKDRLGKEREIGETSETPETPETSDMPKTSDMPATEAPTPALGEYKNVYLTKEEYDKLKAEFPDSCDAKIDRLSEYMRQTGRSYSNHYATVRAWAKEDKNKHENSGKNKPENTCAMPSSFETDDFFMTALQRSYGVDVPL